MFWKSAVTLAVLLLVPLAGQAKSIEVSDDPVKGSDDAPLVLVEFGDLQCPACLRCSKEVLPELEAAFVETGKVRLVYLDHPLEMHPRAFDAAVAAQCAGKQGKFWQYHDRIFTYLRYRPEDFEEYAGKLALDMEAFSACLENEEIMEGVREDIRLAERLKLHGTPSFVLARPKAGSGGLKVLKTFGGCPSVEDLGKKIEAQLKKG
ncbi:MAG: thioredoxin domain-containing protein [Acidobacteriota bacterium]